MKKRLCVLFGGQSSEHEVSCVSAAGVIENADKEKFEIIKIGITKDGVWFLYEGTTEQIRSGDWINDTANLKAAVISPCSVHHGIIVFDKPNKKYEILNVDIVFPVLHGKNGEDGTMQGLLKIAGLPFVGCDTYSSAVCMDKITAKILCERAGIPVVPYIPACAGACFNEDTVISESERRFGYPVFVKPANAGSSVGVTKAGCRETLKKGIAEAFLQDKRILIEQAVTGKEVEVSVLGGDPPAALASGEIVPNSEFYDYDTKYRSDKAEYYIPARISAQTDKKIRDAAAEAFVILGCSGLARADFFACADGSFYFNEINTIPGFTPISMYTKLAAHAGISYTELITRLAALAEV